MVWDNRHLLCSPQSQCNRLCSCSSLQVYMLLILVNKFSLLLFFYIRLLVIARILWLGAHIFYNGFHYREQFARLPCKSCRFDQCSPAVSPPEQFIRKGNGAVSHELLSFSAYFYLFSFSRTLKFFQCFICWLLPSCFFRPLSSTQIFTERLEHLKDVFLWTDWFLFSTKTGASCTTNSSKRYSGQCFL